MTAERLHERTMAGILPSAEVAASLVRRSVWFTCTPHPDDHWVFTVKRDSHTELDSAIARVEGMRFGR